MKIKFQKIRIETEKDKMKYMKKQVKEELIAIHNYF